MNKWIAIAAAGVVAYLLFKPGKGKGSWSTDNNMYTDVNGRVWLKNPVVLDTIQFYYKNNAQSFKLGTNFDTVGDTLDKFVG